MKERFEEHKFSASSLKLIALCDGILTNYRNQGYRLSLRQLYYQLVSKDLIENTVKSYKRVGGIVSDARLSGLLDWGMIEDRGREVVYPNHWETPRSILESAAWSFRLDKWVGQENYVEVFVEKDALSGILEPVCNELDIRFTANKGYSSSSAVYEASKRIIRASSNGCDIHIIYLGDHDPSGLDMTRDIKDRLKLFTENDIDLNVHRLALNMNQVEEWGPPENPAKETDSRFEGYRREFGDSSWELDAVEPATLAELVTDQVNDLIDFDLRNEIIEQENAYKEDLEEIAKRY